MTYQKILKKFNLNRIYYSESPSSLLGYIVCHFHNLLFNMLNYSSDSFSCSVCASFSGSDCASACASFSGSVCV